MLFAFTMSYRRKFSTTSLWLIGCMIDDKRFTLVHVLLFLYFFFLICVQYRLLSLFLPLVYVLVLVQCRLVNTKLMESSTLLYELHSFHDFIFRRRCGAPPHLKCGECFSCEGQPSALWHFQRFIHCFIIYCHTNMELLVSQHHFPVVSTTEQFCLFEVVASKPAKPTHSSL